MAQSLLRCLLRLPPRRDGSLCRLRSSCVPPWPWAQDLDDVVRTHRLEDADITIVTHSASEAEASSRGLARVNPITGAPLAILPPGD
jgi:hypothetical protein